MFLRIGAEEVDNGDRYAPLRMLGALPNLIVSLSSLESD